ncbi:MAG: T9SS type A sorting domain-containing protein [Ignavibacteriaceae bacterium]|nr:T9SS type A sorting domain-containing protein [Ignavibacteriaceae bacterium]
MRKFVLAFLMMLSGVVWGQYIGTAPSRDGSIGTNEYGDHTNGINAWSDGARTWYMTWDATNLYIAVNSNGNASSDEMAVFVDIDPQNIPNGGSVSNGSLGSFGGFDGNNYGRLPFRADFVAFIRNDYHQTRTDDGADGWNANTDNSLNLQKTTSGNVQEISIAWSLITGGSIPSSFNIFFYLNGGDPYGGLANYNQDNDFSSNLNLTGRMYFSIASTANNSSTPPFSRLCFVNQRATESISNYGNSFYNVYSVDNQITRHGGTIAISNLLFIASGSELEGSSTSTITMSGSSGEIDNDGTMDANPSSGNDLVFSITGSITTVNSSSNIDVFSLTVQDGGTLNISGENLRTGNTGTITIGSGGTLICGTGAVGEFGGTSNFVLSSGGNIQIGSTDGITTSGATGNIQTDNRTYSTTANYTYNGSSAQATGNGLTAANNLTINNSSGVTLSSSLSEVAGTLTVSSGDLDLNGNTITLGSSATLSETAGNTVKGTSGVIQTTRTLNNLDAVNVAGLGATITTAANMGSTTIQRGHAARTGNGKTSILRYYDIAPDNNTGLNATLVFNYDESELNSKPEANLVLFRSTNGTDWTYRGGNVDAGANTITLSGIDAFSIWTAGDSDNPLPVELTSFTARMTGTNVKLNWATVSEIDNFGFEIERTLVTEGQDNTFSKIGFVEGNGTVYTPKEYTWIDNTVNRPGKYQYRLKQIDTDGDFEYSDAVEVVFEAPKSFELSQNYPNPFNPSTRISFTVPADSRVKISVFNGVGELIKVLEDGIREAGYHSVVFDAASLPSGMYYYRLEAGDFVQSRKMLLIK